MRRRSESTDSRFSFLFSQEGDRSKGLKIARLLAGIDEHGGTIRRRRRERTLLFLTRETFARRYSLRDGAVITIRGLHVQPSHRGKRLSTLLVSFFCYFCQNTFGYYPRTTLINKPLICTALQSLNFSADFKKFPVYLAPGEGGMTEMIHENKVVDLRPQFPYTVCAAQNIELVNERPVGARKVHVLSEFTPPKIDGVENCRIEERLKDSTFKFYSARIVAFVSTVENAKGVMYENAERNELNEYE